jgi:hypothetical protein
MPPRPLYRWKSFWFGVLVIAFLGWAWVRSNYYVETVSFRAPAVSKTGIVGNWSNKLHLRCRSSNWGEPEGLNVRSHREVRVSHWFPEAVDESWPGVSIAHWFLLLLFLVPWAGWLAWRWRRLSRLHRANEAQLDA